MTVKKLGTLQVRALALLDATNQSPLAIYDNTGIKPDWIKNFRRRALKHPSVDNVQKLYEYLSGKRLSV